MRSLAFRAGVALAALSCLCALFLATAAWPSRVSANLIAGRAQEKVLETTPPIFNEPVQITGAIAAKKAVKFGEKVAGGDDWLKGAKFRLKNSSGKKIVFIELDVNFPETRASGAEVSYRINLGRIPNISHSAEPLSILPGAEVEADVDDKRYGDLVKLVEHRHRISDISRALVQVGFVVFEDGTAWSAGVFYRQDAENPRRWLPIGH
jgi:hypothetical protein